ncbi:MAG: nucleotidyltransferase family protein [Deltaproteobacteria bacterium]|nr:nucleotidyltransferase family protein [Deltaproteobacteria bacterium]
MILAAGPGTRLKPLTNSIPKALIAVGAYPLAEHVLRGYASVGVDNIAFVTGYMAKKVESYFGDGSRWELSTHFLRQGETPGTAAALLEAAQVVNTNPFFVSYGDVYLHDPANYRRLLEFHLDGGYDFSLLVNEVDDPHEGSAVTVEDGRVTHIVEKPPKGTSATKWNKRGVLLFDHRIFDLIDEIAPSPSGELYLTDAIQLAVERGLSVGALPVEGFSSDVGTPERLAEARKVAETKAD